jgi:hypothetical protein
MEEYKIYRIVCNETKEIYFGKTIRTLEHRLSEHKDLRCSSKQIIERGNYYIEQIDSTFDKEESIILERYYIETYDCVNQILPGRSRKEYLEENPEYMKEYGKKWREENKEQIKEYGKKWREENSEQLKEYKKKWHEENPEYYKEYMKKYYEANKDELSEKKKEKYTCECGSTLRKDCKADHESSETHIYFMKNGKKKEIKGEQYTCECGSTLTKNKKARHERESKKHINYLVATGEYKR